MQVSYSLLKRKLSHGVGKLGVALALLTPIVLLGVWVCLARWHVFPSSTVLDSSAKFFDVLLKISSISALVIGGSWSWRGFLRQRLTAPRLNVTQSIQSRRLPDNRWLVKIYATLSNIG